MYRNITLASDRNKNLVETRWGDDNYLYLHHPGWTFPSDCVRKRPIIYFDDLLQILYEKIRYQYDFPTYIQEVLTDIEKNENFAMMVDKSLLHQAFRKVLIYHSYSFTSEEILLNEDDFAVSRNENIIDKLMEDLKNAIQDIYYHKGKIDLSMLTNYHIIIKHYFSDLIKDGHADALPEYWNTFCPGTDTFVDHKSRLEYLIRLGKEKMRFLYKKI
ncbi:TPA: hypothetical protein DCG86_01645 [Candidatus Marinimicrobia bacterium]|nr:hypothetical protein [Candidatus Neomarinimicrobiota bacterium]